MTRLLTAGSLNTDLVMWVEHAPEAGETVTGESFAIFGGGKGANQTLSAARSGADVAMLGAIGSDDFGRARLADLEREGIDTGCIQRFDDVASGVALITIEKGGENRIAYTLGAGAKITPEQARDAVSRVRPSTILSTLELPEPVLEALFAAGRDIGATIIVNATPEPSAHAALAVVADILIVNETEAREILNWSSSQQDWEAAAVRLAALGPSIVIITLGATGALVLTAEGVRLLPPPKVVVVDTTGAGDAFCGAFAARIANGESIISAAEDAVIAGALATTVEGAQPSQPTRAQIDAVKAGT